MENNIKFDTTSHFVHIGQINKRNKPQIEANMKGKKEQNDIRINIFISMAKACEKWEEKLNGMLNV